MGENTAESPEVKTRQRRVVLGFDGSEGSERALEWAASQAERSGHVLEIHTVHNSQYGFVTPDEVQRAMGDLLEQAVARALKVAPRVATTVVAHLGNVAHVLVEVSRDADLLVVGSRGLGGFRGLLLGSVGHNCVRHAHCPVVVVRPAESATEHRHHWPPRRIVVGIDGTASSAAALEWAMKEAELTGSAVVATSTWTWPNYFGWGMPLPADIDMAKDAEILLSRILDPAVERHPSVAVRSNVVSGHPAEILVDASRYADLVVVGSRGHGQVVGALLGSVSEHCVTRADCPVAVIHGHQRHGHFSDPAQL